MSDIYVYITLTQRMLNDSKNKKLQGPKGFFYFIFIFLEDAQGQQQAHDTSRTERSRITYYAARSQGAGHRSRAGTNSGGKIYTLY